MNGMLLTNVDYVRVEFNISTKYFDKNPCIHILPNLQHIQITLALQFIRDFANYFQHAFLTK